MKGAHVWHLFLVVRNVFFDHRVPVVHLDILLSYLGIVGERYHSSFLLAFERVPLGSAFSFVAKAKSL